MKSIIKISFLVLPLITSTSYAQYNVMPYNQNPYNQNPYEPSNQQIVKLKISDNRYIINLIDQNVNEQ